MADRMKALFYRVHPQHFHSWLMRMPWVQRSDSSLGVLLLHPHTLVMWSAEEESCHQSVPGPSEQGRSTGGSGSWPTFSLSQHLKVSSRITTKRPDKRTLSSPVKGRRRLGGFGDLLFDERNSPTWTAEKKGIVRSFCSWPYEKITGRKSVEKMTG